MIGWIATFWVLHKTELTDRARGGAGIDWCWDHDEALGDEAAWEDYSRVQEHDALMIYPLVSNENKRKDAGEWQYQRSGYFCGVEYEAGNLDKAGLLDCRVL